MYIDDSDEPFQSKVIGNTTSGHEKDGTTWLSSMLIIVANVMGIGALGLAHAFSKVGWILGFFCLFIAFALSVQSGLLLSRMKQKIPSAMIYADLGQAAYGNLGAAFSTVFSYSYLVGLAFSFHLSASLALKEMTDGLCFVYCAAIVSAIVLPIAQYRSFEELKSMVYIGAVAIVLPVLIIIFEIAIRGRYGQVSTTMFDDASFESSTVACMDVLFAITGQVIFVEIMAEMKDPSEFPKAVYGSSSVFVVFYTLMASVGYYFIGQGVMNPITYNLTNDFSRRLCSAFVLVHIIVAYVMQIVVLARAFERLVLRQEHEDSKHASYRDRVVWCLITSMFILMSFLVSNITPFINSLMGFVGAMSGVTTTYVLPFIFAAVILQDEMSRLEQWLYRTFGVIAIGVGLLGVYASVQVMISTYDTKVAFEC